MSPPCLPPPALILLFYLVFYGFLTALFTLTMWVLLQTVDPFLPTYQDRLSIPGESLPLPPSAQGGRNGARFPSTPFRPGPAWWKACLDVRRSHQRLCKPWVLWSPKPRLGD